ncbi:MAG TPA: type II toxin-antitoxin system VapC family toxin [Rhodopila sp.]|jgi:PIN domain nuclease of toxin-antitoxin system
MRLLLDTHVLLWLLNDDRLDPTAGRALADPGSALYVSVVSLWEVVVKQRVGKLKADIEVIVGHMAPASKLQWLSITSDHLVALNRLPRREQHRDPFDHLIIAQAISEGMTLLTRDRNASLYSVQILSA